MTCEAEAPQRQCLEPSRQRWPRSGVSRLRNSLTRPAASAKCSRRSQDSPQTITPAAGTPAHVVMACGAERGARPLRPGGPRFGRREALERYSGGARELVSLGSRSRCGGQHRSVHRARVRRHARPPCPRPARSRRGDLVRRVCGRRDRARHHRSRRKVLVTTTLCPNRSGTGKRLRSSPKGWDQGRRKSKTAKPCRDLGPAAGFSAPRGHWCSSISAALRPGVSRRR